MQQFCNKQAGFNLIELLAVIAIIGILMAILIPVASNVRAAAYQSQCASNMRQIGMGLRLYADENDGWLPSTAHLGREDSWILALRPYLDDVDEIRICPVDPRIDEMRRRPESTSYIVNDIIFTPEFDDFFRPVGEDFRQIDRLQNPSGTKLAFIQNERRGLNIANDHTHARLWRNNWGAFTHDVAPDRHRAGSQSSDRTHGRSNYLYADGHVSSINAQEIKNRIESGENIAFPPELR